MCKADSAPAHQRALIVLAKTNCGAGVASASSLFPSGYVVSAPPVELSISRNAACVATLLSRGSDMSAQRSGLEPGTTGDDLGVK